MVRNKTALNFTASSIFRTFSGMAVSFLALRVIGPEKLGLWQAALLVQPYIGFLQLGLTQGISRELPIFMGRGQTEKVEEFAATAQFVTAIYTTGFLLISFFLVLFVAEGIEGKLIYLTAGVFIATMFTDNYLSSTYRSSSSFRDLSKIYFASSFLNLLLLPLIYYFEFQGYLILLFINSSCATLLLVIFRPIKVPLDFKKEVFFATIKTGFPLLILNFFRTIPDTYPRLIILFFLSTAALGLTAPANAAYMAFAMLPAALAKYIYPQMTYNFGKTGDKYQLWKTIRKLFIYLSAFGTLGLISLFFVPFVIENYFPQYREATFITTVAIVIGFLRMYSVLSNVFNTLKSYKVQSIIGVVRNVVYLLFPLGFYYFSSFTKLNAIFVGILCGELITVFVSIYYLYKVTHEESTKIKNNQSC